MQALLLAVAARALADALLPETTREPTGRTGGLPGTVRAEAEVPAAAAVQAPPLPGCCRPDGADLALLASPVDLTLALGAAAARGALVEAASLAPRGPGTGRLLSAAELATATLAMALASGGLLSGFVCGAAGLVLEALATREPAALPRLAFHGLIRGIFYGDWSTAHGDHAEATSDQRISADGQRGDAFPSGRARYHRPYTHSMSRPVGAYKFCQSNTNTYCTLFSAFRYAGHPRARRERVGGVEVAHHLI